MVLIPGGGQRLGDLPEGGKPVPGGTYYLRSDKSEAKIAKAAAKNAGAMMANVTFTVIGPAEQEVNVGRKLFENFILVGDGLWRARQFFEASGEGPEFRIEDTDQFLNREVAAYVDEEPERSDPDDPTGQKMFSAKNIIKKFFAIPR